ncbi:MAG: hypothetical protein ABIO44_05875, partial [Saprospiraceae bacterium]
NGKLNIDRLNFFSNCTFKLNAGASIHVTNGNSMFSTTSLYSACSDIMYQGIVVEKGGFLIFQSNTIEHANYGILIEADGIAFQISNNSFIRNNIGIGVRKDALVGNDIYSNTFDGFGGLLSGFDGQTPEREYLPFTGIEVQDNIITVGTVGANIFQNLRNGIISINSSITVQNNTFTSMVSGQNQAGATIDGNGIFATGSNLVHVNLNDFDECYFGINSYASSLTNVEYNTMNHIGTGILDRHGRLTTRIFNNIISYGNFGIRVLNAERNTNPSIYYNELTDLTQKPDRKESIAIQMNNAFGTAPTHHPEINYNIITLNFHNIGIETNNVSGVGYYNNEITGENFKTGIHLVVSRYGHLFENTVTAGFFHDFLTGIHVEISQDTRYCCNTVENCSQGFLFTGACPRSTWRNNIITRCNIGLLISSGAFIGTQMLVVPAGNSWTTWTAGNNHGVNAENGNSTGSRQFLRSQIRALGCTLPQWPLFISPAQSCDNNPNNWFITTEVSNVTCFSDGPCEVSFAFSPVIDNWSIDVATGAFLAEDFGDMHQWEGNRALYKDL